MNADIEKKIATYNNNKAKQSKCLAVEVSTTENLRRTRAKTQDDVRQANLEIEDQIVEFQKTIIGIVSLGHRF